MQENRRGAVSIDTFAAWCGMIWFVFIIDASFTWYFTKHIRDIIGSLFVFTATIALNQNRGLILSRQRLALVLPVLVLAAYTLLVRHWIYYPFKYLPFICLICWRSSVLQKIYKYFRNFIVFYAIVSIVVEILVLSGLWTSLPYITIFPPQDYVQEQLGYVNYFYGFFCIPATDLFLSFYRACGPLREGGHFSIFLGFLYFSEAILYKKRSVWLIICGLLTLSPNFFIFFIVTEGYIAIAGKQVLKPILVFFCFVTIVGLAYRFSPTSIQNSVVQIVFERSLEENISNVESEGYMAMLDGRTDEYGQQNYYQFQQKGLGTKLFGTRIIEGHMALSDYRLLLMFLGYVGTFMILWCTYSFTFKCERNLFGACLLLLALTVFIQRAWMYLHVYLWVMMFLIIIENKRLKQQRLIWQNH